MGDAWQGGGWQVVGCVGGRWLVGLLVGLWVVLGAWVVCDGGGNVVGVPACADGRSHSKAPFQEPFQESRPHKEPVQKSFQESFQEPFQGSGSS